jgi:methylated-DNA-[protein]-cysteine S-methyltransferase
MNSSNPECYDAITATPVGLVCVRLQGDAVVEVGFPPPGTLQQEPASAVAAEVVRQIRAYFSNARYVPDLPLAIQGTAFQQQVWQALRTIPPGEVLTYGALARRLGSAARAVGGACRANPCPILVPCHRVVAAHGKGGYAGAIHGHWLAIKEYLLQHEGAAWPL